MAISIPDHFNNREGILADYDTPVGYSTTIRDQILANQHVDLRRLSNSNFGLRTTQADLDFHPQAFLDNRTQANIETQLIAPAENWQITNTTGVSTTPVYEQYNRWPALKAQVNTSTATVEFEFRSYISATVFPGIDVLDMDYLSFVVPDFYLLIDDIGTVVQLTSHPSGAIGTDTTFDSVIVNNVNNQATLPQESRLLLSDFGAGTTGHGNFSLSSITGIRIHLKFVGGAFTSSDKITIIGIRAMKTNYRPQTNDVNTLIGAIVPTPTFSGLNPQTAELFVPLIRGEKWEVSQGVNDPKVIDGTLSMRFFSGAMTTSSNGTDNNVILIFRERRAANQQTGSHIEAIFRWRSGQSFAWSQSVTHNTGAPPNHITTTGSLISYISGVPALTTNSWYIFQATLRNQTMTMNLYRSDENGTLGTKIWDSTAQNSGSNVNYSAVQGRMGFNLLSNDRDIVWDDFNSNAVSFSLIRTKAKKTFTPVIGAQLKAAYSLDTNLFESFQGSDPSNGGIFVDTTKTYSGNTSYRTQLPIFTNEFYVEDWQQMYIRMYVWVPTQVSTSNQPYPVLRSNQTLSTIILPKPPLQPNIWNLMDIDLSQLQGNPTGVFYSLYLESGQNAKTPYPWYVDNSVLIARRNISWQVRAKSNAPWREFRDAVNDGNAGVHFPIEERGTEPQLQIVALTQEAWVSNFSVKWIKAQLGKPTYY